MLSCFFRYLDCSKKIITINVGIFLLICFIDLSFFSPSQQILIRFGAIDPVKLALGEWWRLVTANFIHFGVIHLAFNCFALHILGSQIEKILGRFYFILVYVFSGISATLYSSYFNLSLACGASGAIFGLIGVGTLLEIFFDKRSSRLFTGKKLNDLSLRLILNRWPCSALALLNIMLAIFFNYIGQLLSLSIRIDNSAHLGGFFSGASLFYFIIAYRKFKLGSKRSLLGMTPFLINIFQILLVSYYLFATPYIKQNYFRAAQSSNSNLTSFFYYSQALKIDPFFNAARFEIGRLYIMNGEYAHAVKEFNFIIDDSLMINKFHELIEELVHLNRTKDALFVRSLLYKKKYL